MIGYGGMRWEKRCEVVGVNDNPTRIRLIKNSDN